MKNYLFSLSNISYFDRAKIKMSKFKNYILYEIIGRPNKSEYDVLRESLLADYESVISFDNRFLAKSWTDEG